MSVKIDEISSSNSFSTRDEINYDVVDHYSELIQNGTKLPPITVFQEPLTKKYTILDGFHTYHAALKAKLEFIDVEIINENTDLDLFVEGVKRNSSHGHPLTSKDRRRNIERILSLEGSHSWSNQVIANIVGTSDRTVANVKSSLPSPKISGITEIKCFRKGKPHTVTMNLPPVSIPGPLELPTLTSTTSLLPESFDNDYLTPGTVALIVEESEVMSEVSELQKVTLVSSMKALQQKLLSFSKSYADANDGEVQITKMFAKNLSSLVAEIRIQTDDLCKIINEIHGEL